MGAFPFPRLPFPLTARLLCSTHSDSWMPVWFCLYKQTIVGKLVNPSGLSFLVCKMGIKRLTSCGKCKDSMEEHRGRHPASVRSSVKTGSLPPRLNFLAG